MKDLAKILSHVSRQMEVCQCDCKIKCDTPAFFVSADISGEKVWYLLRALSCNISELVFSRLPGRVAQSVGHLTRKSEVLGSIPGLATYFRFSFRWFKRNIYIYIFEQSFNGVVSIAQSVEVTDSAVLEVTDSAVLGGVAEVVSSNPSWAIKIFFSIFRHS